jgi:hemerythrin-like domain-containing protein
MSRRHDSLIPLSHQHQHALALAVIIRRRVGSENREDAWREEMTEKIRKLYAAELTGHFEVEETVLFSEMERYLGPLKLVTELQREHQALHEMIRRLPPRVAPSLSVLDQFSSSIEQHVRKEERELFMEFEKKMPADEARKIGVEIDARLLKACPRL